MMLVSRAVPEIVVLFWTRVKSSKVTSLKENSAVLLLKLSDWQLVSDKMAIWKLPHKRGKRRNHIFVSNFPASRFAHQPFVEVHKHICRSTPFEKKKNAWFWRKAKWQAASADICHSSFRWKIKKQTNACHLIASDRSRFHETHMLCMNLDLDPDCMNLLCCSWFWV